MPINDAFVESDKFRRAVFTEIAAGESDPDRIAKKHHLVKPAVKRAVQDLVDHELIEETDDGLQLTDQGEEYQADRKRRDIGA